MTKRRILIVDDEPHVIRVLRLTLEREGYGIETAANGAEALEKIAEARPDVLITDLQMPKLGGRGLCEAVRERFPEDDFLILVMTSMTALEEREWVRRLKGIEFFEKPLSPRRLSSQLAAYFNSHAVSQDTDHG